MPVGIFRPMANTDAVYPGGKTIDGGNCGLKNAVLDMHWGEVEGFATVAAWAAAGNPTSGPKAHKAARVYNRLRCIAPPQSLLSARGMFVEAAHLSCPPKGEGARSRSSRRGRAATYNRHAQLEFIPCLIN